MRLNRLKKFYLRNANSSFNVIIVSWQFFSNRFTGRYIYRKKILPSWTNIVDKVLNLTDVLFFAVVLNVVFDFINETNRKVSSEFVEEGFIIFLTLG